MVAYFSIKLPIINERNKQKNNAPIHGRKNGTNAIELNNVDIIMLKLLKLNNYKRIIDIPKCYTTINKVACIKLVI